MNQVCMVPVYYLLLYNCWHKTSSLLSITCVNFHLHEKHQPREYSKFTEILAISRAYLFLSGLHLQNVSLNHMNQPQSKYPQQTSFLSHTILCAHLLSLLDIPYNKDHNPPYSTVNIMIYYLFKYKSLHYYYLLLFLCTNKRIIIFRKIGYRCNPHRKQAV